MKLYIQIGLRLEKPPFHSVLRKVDVIKKEIHTEVLTQQIGGKTRTIGLPRLWCNLHFSENLTNIKRVC